MRRVSAPKTSTTWITHSVARPLTDAKTFGGYIAPNNLPQFASFWLVMEANKDTVCVECGTRFDDRFEPNDTPCTARPYRYA